MEILPKLIRNLQSAYFRNPNDADLYPGAWISYAVYDLSYPELGQLLAEMLPLLETEEFEVHLNADGSNIFEEFTCTIVETLLKRNGVITETESVRLIQIDSLLKILEECETNILR